MFYYCLISHELAICFIIASSHRSLPYVFSIIVRDPLKLLHHTAEVDELYFRIPLMSQ